MSTVNEIVRSAIYNYPALYAHRTDVLTALLVGYGNGHEWVNGELVNLDDTGIDLTEDEVIWEPHWLTQQNLTSGNPLARQYAEEDVATLNAKNVVVLERRRNADTLAITTGPLTDPPRQFTPDFSLMDTAPANVTADWVAAITEVAAVLAAHR